MVSPEEPRPVVEIANGAVRMTCRHQSCETDQPRGHATGTEIPPSAAVATSRWTGRLSSVPVREEAAVENFGQLLVLGSCYVYVATKVGAIRQIPLRAAKKHKQKSTLLVRVSEDGWRQRLLVRARTGRGGSIKRIWEIYTRLVACDRSLRQSFRFANSLILCTSSGVNAELNSVHELQSR